MSFSLAIDLIIAPIPPPQNKRFSYPPIQVPFYINLKSARACSDISRDFKIQRRDGYENSLKKWICFFSVFSQLFLVKCRRTLLELNSLGPHPSTEREVKFRRCLFTSSIKREIRHFYVLHLHLSVVNDRWGATDVATPSLHFILFSASLTASQNFNPVH